MEASLGCPHELRSTLAALGNAGETILDAGLMYRAGEPVLIRIRRRGPRYDIIDDGAAVSLARKPTGWLERVERLVAAEGFNVNRRGVLFVPAIEGRDITSLALRLAATSRSVYLDLLEATVA